MLGLIRHLAIECLVRRLVEQVHASVDRRHATLLEGGSRRSHHRLIAELDHAVLLR